MSANRPMATKKSAYNEIGVALKTLRVAKRLSQESFGLVSSRTYVSSVERGIKNPTVTKVDQLAEQMGVHPLTLLTVAYLGRPTSAHLARLQDQVAAELLKLAVLDR